MIRRLFWNAEENRMAMVWRLVLQFFMLAASLVVLTLLLVLALLAFGQIRIDEVVTGGFSPANLPAPFSGLSLGVQEIALIGSVWLAARFFDRRRFSDLGLKINRQWRIDLAFGLALGAALQVLIFVVELVAGWVKVTGTFYVPMDALRVGGLTFALAAFSQMLAFTLVGFSEELLFRGYQLKNGSEGLANVSWIGPRTSIWVSVVASSVFFGAAHLQNPNATASSVINIALAGGMLALGYVLTGQLAIPIGLHITWNYFQGNVFGFPVSGTDAGPTFIAIQQRGSTLATGGAFGPEGGLVGLGALLLGTLAIVAWVRWRHGGLSLHHGLTTPDLRAKATSEATLATKAH